MSLLTFPWDDVGDGSGMQIVEICHTISHAYTGYSATRVASTKMQKAFTINWTARTPAQWLAFVEFWRSVYGNAHAFYWEFPAELYGSPGYGGYGGLEPDDGFDADDFVGAGDGPIFTVRFDQPELPQKYLTGFNRWDWDATFREVS